MQSQISVLQGRIQSTPAVEQQYKESDQKLPERAGVLQRFARRSTTKQHIGRDLNRQQEGEHFDVLDPRELADDSVIPQEDHFAGAGLGGGLALGLAILYLLAALDPSMHTERDVEVCMKLPVLAMVPNVAPAGRAAEPGGKGEGLDLPEHES